MRLTLLKSFTYTHETNMLMSKHAHEANMRKSGLTPSLNLHFHTYQSHPGIKDESSMHKDTYNLTTSINLKST